MFLYLLPSEHIAKSLIPISIPLPSLDCNYSDPRIRYDGINWWITVGIEYEDSVTVPSNDGIGIDLILIKVFPF